MNVEVIVSSEDRDNFIKNMLTVCAEERTLIAVRVLLPAFLALHAPSKVQVDAAGLGFSSPAFSGGGTSTKNGSAISSTGGAPSIFTTS
jgi:hypothetical protein